MAAEKTVFKLFVRLNTRYEHFYNLKLLYSGYLSQILWYKRNLFFCCQCPLRITPRPRFWLTDAAKENISSSRQAKLCVCTLQVRFLLSPFPIVSVAVLITVFALFDRCLNIFQSITKHSNTGAKLSYIPAFVRKQGSYAVQSVSTCFQLSNWHDVFLYLG